MNNLIIIAILFIMGLIFFIKNQSFFIEGFDNKTITKEMLKNNCPNILMKKDNEIYLYNSSKAKIPGVNPIKFNNLDDYTEFVSWQNSQGIYCPVLFLENTYDTQNNTKYNVRSNPFLQPDTSLDLKLLNGRPIKNGITSIDSQGTDVLGGSQNYFAPYDPNNQYIGLKTPLDTMFDDKSKISANPMSSNWGGDKYTTSLIKDGDFKGDYVYKLSQTYGQTTVN